MKSMQLLLKFKKQKLPMLILTASYPQAKGSIMAPINVHVFISGVGHRGHALRMGKSRE